MCSPDKRGMTTVLVARAVAEVDSRQIRETRVVCRCLMISSWVSAGSPMNCGILAPPQPCEITLHLTFVDLLGSEPNWRSPQ